MQGIGNSNHNNGRQKPQEGAAQSSSMALPQPLFFVQTGAEESQHTKFWQTWNTVFVQQHVLGSKQAYVPRAPHCLGGVYGEGMEALSGMDGSSVMPQMPSVPYGEAIWM